MVHLTDSVIRFVRDEEGANAAEYALVLALVAIAIIGGATLLGQNIDTSLTDAANTVGP